MATEMPVFVTERLDALRREAAHAKADTDLLRAQHEGVQAAEADLSRKLQHLPNASETDGVRAALKEQITQAQGRTADVRAKLHAAVERGRSAGQAVTQAGHFLSKLTAGTRLVDVRPTLPPMSMDQARVGLLSARGAVAELVNSPVPDEELKRTAEERVRELSSKLRTSASLDHVGALKLSFGGSVSPELLPLLSMLLPQPLTDVIYRELQQSQRGKTGTPLPSKERERRLTELRERIALLEHVVEAQRPPDQPRAGPLPRAEVLLGCRPEGQLRPGQVGRAA